ncbi:MAG: hypothetical protein ACT4PV_09320 [Planctomycetaceae bacterium]
MAPVTLRLSRLAYVGLGIALAGALAWIVGEFRGIAALDLPSRILLGAGALVYLVARLRMPRG